MTDNKKSPFMANIPSLRLRPMKLKRSVIKKGPAYSTKEVCEVLVVKLKSILNEKEIK